MEFVPGGLVILICLILILTIIFIFVWRIFCSKGDRVQAEVDLESAIWNTTTEIDQLFGIISSSSKGIDQIVQPKRDQHSGPDKSIVLDVRTILGNYTPRMDQNLSDGQSVKADPTNAMQM